MARTRSRGPSRGYLTRQKDESGQPLGRPDRNRSCPNQRRALTGEGGERGEGARCPLFSQGPCYWRHERILAPRSCVCRRNSGNSEGVAGIWRWSRSPVLLRLLPPAAPKLVRTRRCRGAKPLVRRRCGLDKRETEAVPSCLLLRATARREGRGKPSDRSMEQTTASEGPHTPKPPRCWAMMLMHAVITRWKARGVTHRPGHPCPARVRTCDG